jgi:hypothetical protein
MSRPIAWRAVPQKRAGGTYYVLSKGKKDPVHLALGYVAEEVARVACERANALLDAGDDEKLVRLYRTDVPAVHADPEAPAATGTVSGRDRAVAYLTADAALNLEALLGPARVDHAAMTVEEYFDKIFWPVRSDPSTPIGVSADTAATEKGYWQNVSRGRGILQGEIGATKLRDLDDQMWERWQESQPISARSKVLRRNAYAALLSWARRQGHLDFRPEFFRIKGSTKTTRVKEDPLDLTELIALLDASDPVRRAMWALGAGVGLRPGELVRVEWQDVDWTDHVLAVRGT